MSADDFLRRLREALERTGIPYMLAGSRGMVGAQGLRPRRGRLSRPCWAGRSAVGASFAPLPAVNTTQRKLQAVQSVSGRSYSPVSSNIVDALERLAALRQQGHLSQEEFRKAKERLLFD